MMNLKPDTVEIDHHTIKLIVGLIAITLAPLTNYFSQTPLDSISVSYHMGGWSRNILVGFLFAISAFFWAYNGRSAPQMILSKVAAIASLGVAMFPCKCGRYQEIIPYAHYVSAAVMFLILAFFCYTFFWRAYAKGHSQAIVRAGVYAFCGLIMLASMVILALNFLLDNAIALKIDRLVFWCEATALTAFGLAWLVASRILPIITSSKERLSL